MTAELGKGEALLLVREDPLPGWVVLGAIGIDQAGWLRKLAVGKQTEEISAEAWRGRVALVVPQLESPQVLVAKIAPGELIGVIGPNGCGKSTLLKAMSRILTCSSGDILLDGVSIFTMDTKRLAKRIAILLQRQENLSGITVEEIVSYGRFPHRKGLRLSLIHISEPTRPY